jgi:hypothetical protein
MDGVAAEFGGVQRIVVPLILTAKSEVTACATARKTWKKRTPTVLTHIVIADGADRLPAWKQ